MYFFNPERELLMLRAEFGRSLVAAHYAGRDTEQMRAIFSPREPEELPRSLIVRMMYNHEHAVGRMAEAIAAYDTFLEHEPRVRPLAPR